MKLLNNNSEVVYSNSSGIQTHNYGNLSSLLSLLYQTAPTTADKYMEFIQKPVWMVSLILFILGTLANGLTIWAIMYIPQNQRSPHLKFIISLACSDISILFATFCGDFIHILSTLHDDCISTFKTLLLNVALLATLLNLLAMATNHYLATFKELQHRILMTNSRVNYIICIIWLISVSVACIQIVTGLLLAESTLKTQPFDSFCAAVIEEPYTIQMLIIIISFVILIIICIIYLKIFFRVKISHPRRSRRKDSKHTPGLKTLWTVILFIGTFLLFWTPQGVYYIYCYMHVLLKMESKHDTQHIGEVTLVNDILFLILQLNSLADPIIYAIRLPKVQRGYHTLCCKNIKPLIDLNKCFSRRHTMMPTYDSISNQERIHLDYLQRLKSNSTMIP